MDFGFLRDFRRLYGRDANEANLYRDLHRIIFGLSSLKNKLRMSKELRAQFPLEGLKLSEMMGVFRFAYRRFFPGKVISTRRADIARKELASARKQRYSNSEFCDWFVKIMEDYEETSSVS